MLVSSFMSTNLRIMIRVVCRNEAVFCYVHTTKEGKRIFDRSQGKIGKSISSIVYT